MATQEVIQAELQDCKETLYKLRKYLWNVYADANEIQRGQTREERRDPETMAANSRREYTQHMEIKILDEAQAVVHYQLTLRQFPEFRQAL